MKKSNIVLSYALSVLSVLLYILIPSRFTFSKTVEFVFAAITVAVAAAALVLFIISTKKLNFNKEFPPLYVPSVMVLVAALVVMLIRLIYAFSLGFVPVLGTGFFNYAAIALVAFSIFNTVGSLYVALMKTDKN